MLFFFFLPVTELSLHALMWAWLLFIKNHSTVPSSAEEMGNRNKLLQFQSGRFCPLDILCHDSQHETDEEPTPAQVLLG